MNAKRLIPAVALIANCVPVTSACASEPIKDFFYSFEDERRENIAAFFIIMTPLFLLFGLYLLLRRTPKFRAKESEINEKLSRALQSATHRRVQVKDESRSSDDAAE